MEKHGVSVSEKNLVPSFNVIVFKVDGSDRERSWTCYKLSFIFGHFLQVAFFTKQKQFVTSPIFCINSNVQYCIHALNLQLVLISFIQNFAFCISIRVDFDIVQYYNDYIWRGIIAWFTPCMYVCKMVNTISPIKHFLR